LRATQLNAYHGGSRLITVEKYSVTLEQLLFLETKELKQNSTGCSKIGEIKGYIA